MYYQYFGFDESPFSISVNPRYLFMSPQHRDALAHLLYGVGSGGGFILLTGEVGTGKTTINRALLEQMPETVDLAIVLNPALDAVELLATVCDELEIDYPEQTHSLKLLTDALHRFLLANHEAGRKTVLMIDEAQHLDFGVLEQIRLLTNLETDNEKLLQIILVGQPELTEKLSRPELRQLNQRITARYNLESLNVDETMAYIRHRLDVAGLAGSRELFPSKVVRDIHRLTGGIPRQINLLCDRTLLGAYGRRKNRINRKLVLSAATEVFSEVKSRRNNRRILTLSILLITVLSIPLFWLIARGESPWPLSVSGGTALDQQAAQSDDVSDVQPVPVKGATQIVTMVKPSWLLSHTEASQWLWQLSSDSPEPTVACPTETTANIRCVSASAMVWEPILALNRPVLLEMQTPDRFSAATVAVAFEDHMAWVLTRDGLERVLLVDLAQSWRGGYRYLWQPPFGWEKAISKGDNGPSVASVAQLFATLDEQIKPLAQSHFNNELETRVKLFQTSEGIEANGVAGEKTLLKLNDRLRLGMTFEHALRRAQLLIGSKKNSSDTHKQDQVRSKDGGS